MGWRLILLSGMMVKVVGLFDNNWMIVVECFKRKGFSWGGDFSSIQDNPHLEKRGKYYWRDLLIKYNKKDFISEPKYVNITL